MILSPFDRALEVWLADGVVVDEDCGTGAVFLRQRTWRYLDAQKFKACINRERERERDKRWTLLDKFQTFLSSTSPTAGFPL